jgi:hypothetical protein
MPRYQELNPGEICEIVEINGDRTKFRNEIIPGGSVTLSSGPFIKVTYKSSGDTEQSSHGSKPRHTVINDEGIEMTQRDIDGLASFYFVVKGGETATLSGGRKSRRSKSNKNKRTRRKSLKKQHRRK